eukprot:TRINITY_DN688_c0_g1_i1.p1 TRINITY_DN688_c0_g1~~TRINITY_DN688_c0_g1_i1.p1  ORF type:complete len:306 (-),score=67.12 TRINITY_DN688_c0_g1_i1:190-1029(-)
MQQESKIFSQYSGLSPLAKGSNGTVYQSIHRETGQEVVLKKLSKKMAVERISDEIDAGYLLRGIQGVPEFYESMKDEDGTTWLSFEKVNGKDLLSWMEKFKFNPISENDVKLIANELIQIVLSIHESGIAHKDIKCENIVLSNSGELFLVDFGLCYFFQNQEEDEQCTDTCGSIEYAAPELVMSGLGPHPVNFSATKADVWSLGVTLFCLLFGKFPFSFNKAQMQHIESTGAFPPPDFGFKTRISSSGKDFILSVLQSDPNVRPSLRELLQHPWLNLEE